MKNEMLSRFSEWLAGAIGGTSIKILEFHPSQQRLIDQNWSVLADIDGVPKSFSIRKTVPLTVFAGHTIAEEFTLLQVAHEHGVKVPRPIAFCDDPDVLGSSFALLEKIYGTSFGVDVVRDLSLGGDRSTLAQRLGRELAKIHRICPSVSRLSFLDAPTSPPAATEIARMRSIVDRLNIRRPALEWGLRWAEINATNPERITFVHSDFHTGNYILDSWGLAAVLEWKSATRGHFVQNTGVSVEMTSRQAVSERVQSSMTVMEWNRERRSMIRPCVIGRSSRICVARFSPCRWDNSIVPTISRH